MCVGGVDGVEVVGFGAEGGAGCAGECEEALEGFDAGDVDGGGWAGVGVRGGVAGGAKRCGVPGESEGFCHKGVDTLWFA